MKKSERAVACTFSKRAIGIQAQRVFKIKKTGMSECVYMGGRELVPLASTPMDMEKIWHRGYAISV